MKRMYQFSDTDELLGDPSWCGKSQVTGHWNGARRRNHRNSIKRKPGGGRKERHRKDISLPNGRG